MQLPWRKRIGFACLSVFLALMPIVPVQAAPLLNNAANVPASSAPGEDFTIVLIPDPQNESDGHLAMFTAQTNWIVANKASSNIVFVTAAGDMVNRSNSNSQYQNADAAIDILDAGGVWYTMAPGNHDNPGLYPPPLLYPGYFGVSRYADREVTDGYWFGGYYDDYNTYSLFSAGGMDFILINLQYSPPVDVLNWADALLTTHSDRRAIVEQHNLLNVDNSWNNQASYLALKDHSNLFLMLCGHMHTPLDGAAYLEGEGDDGHTIHIVQADYQEMNSGNGYLRLLRFSPADDTIHMTTYSPYTGEWITTWPDQMDLAYDMHHDLTVAVEGNGTTAPSAGDHSYAAGTIVDIIATPAAGWYFDHWSGACTGAGACQVTMNASKSVTASFVVDPSPTVLSIVRADPDPTSAANVDFVVTFSEPVNGVDTIAPFDDFELTTTGVMGARITEVSGSDATWTVTVNTGTGSGTIRLDVPVDATLADPAGNPLADLPFTEGQAYTIEQGPGKYDDAEEGWTYSGFVATTTTGPYLGTMHYSKGVGNTAEFTFIGSQIVLTYSKYSNRGTLEVYLDDDPTPIATINQYNATRVWQANWTSGNLGAGKHTVRLVHAISGQVDIDALEVKEYQLPGLGKHDDTHADWVYSGFTATTTTGPYLGTMHYSKVIGNDAEFTFEGSQVTLWYSKYRNRGELEVYLDDDPTPIATIDQYNATRVWQASWTSSDLGAGEHTIRLVHASGAQVDIDALEVKTYQYPILATYDNVDAGWVYSGFTPTTTTGPYLGTMHYSKVIGSGAEFTFTGQQITLVYSKYSNRGTLTVYIDDNPEPVTTIDQYNATRVWQATWTSEDLGAGEHTVRLIHASGARVDIDALIVRAP